ncbi:gp64 [Bacillus phage G]|uniref:Gp64 n=1 Tax=Bacillus phage G TaxID=2884420 RepID=G3MBD4_9CAUD|nr:gp64 [Bacillus phage G]AEO93335.1 gp64 [Bacillus phage G]
MKKLPWIRIIITIVAWVGLTMYQNYFMVFDTNKIAMGQLENSNEAYAKWQAWKHVIDYYWVLYLLPLLMFIPYAFKNKNKLGEL